MPRLQILRGYPINTKNHFQVQYKEIWQYWEPERKSRSSVFFSRCGENISV